MYVSVNLIGCTIYLKGRNFESNSQQIRQGEKVGVRCTIYLKGRNFESNSQQSLQEVFQIIGCTIYLKGRNFESNSQHYRNRIGYYTVVRYTSKVEISKAIHNIPCHHPYYGNFVRYTSKVEISKAIHNELALPRLSSRLYDALQRQKTRKQPTHPFHQHISFYRRIFHCLRVYGVE